MTAPRPTATEAGPLVHAICERVARDHMIRTLAIKGPVLALQGLRHPRASADVDVLVHPDEYERFIDSLRTSGWYEAVETSGPRLIPAHAVNMLHSHWPVGIDVHHHFPGFLASDREVFMTLWRRRTTVELAGMPITACDFISHIAIVGLHLLREDAEGQSWRVRDLVVRASQRMRVAERNALIDLAIETDSIVPLRPVLTQLGLGEAEHATTANLAGLDAWLTEATARPGTAWGHQLRGTPWRRWPSTLWHAATLTNAEIDAYHGGGMTPAGRLRARASRLRRGASLAPGILRGYRSSRQSGTPPS